MSFFKKYNGTAHAGLMRLETLIWVLIYGGLLTLVVGLFMSRNEQDAGFECGGRRHTGSHWCVFDLRALQVARGPLRALVAWRRQQPFP